MKVTSIEAKTLPEAWFLCVKGLAESTTWHGIARPAEGVHSYVVGRGSFKGERRLEYDFINVHIEYPGSLPLIPDVPEGVPPPTTVDYVDDYYHRYIIGTRRAPKENYTYGEDINPQVPKVLEMLQEDPNTNQACITLGDRDSINLPDPQCLKVVDFRLMGGVLSVAVYVRSWDLWAGFPSNLAAIQLLKEDLARGIGAKDGEMIACSKGLHLYGYIFETASMVLRSKQFSG